MATPKHITFTLEDPSFVGIDEVQRNGIGNEIVNTIQTRTSKGIDKDGNAFTQYSEAYKSSSHFKGAGKTSKVDLVFSDQMMNSLQYLPNLSGGSRVTVGFVNGSEANKRAQYTIEGHGRKGDFTQPSRNPMGLTTSERTKIVGMVSGGNRGAVFLALAAGFLASIF